MLSNKSSLEIILDDDFTGIMYGLPEESLGCKLKGKLVLNNKDSLSVKHLLFVFTGKITVACGPPMSTSRPEYSETQIIYRKEYLFHNSTSSNRKIPAGKHEYSFNFDLPGHLPSSFKGSRGKIEYYCSAYLSRPMFRNNITSKKIVHLQRCLMDETRATQTHHTIFTEGSLDRKIKYQISTPIMTFREGGLVHVELTLKSTDSENVIENVEYGLKEQIHYRTTGEQPNAIVANFDQSSYPFGKRQVKIDPNDTSPIIINFRLCPWVNCDVDSQLINVNHKLSFTVCVSRIVNIEDEDEILNEETNQQSDRRFSVPVSRQAESREERRVVHRTTSLLPAIRDRKAEFRNSRTFSLSNLMSYQKAALPITKIEKKRMHFEIPIIITTKSSKPEHPTPPYNFVDRPPDYAIASMIPPPPEYVPDISSETAELLLSEYLANGFVAYEEDA